MELANYIESLGTPSEAIFAVAGFLSSAYLLGYLLVAGMRLLSRDKFVARAGVGGVQCNEFFPSITLGIDLLILIAMPCQWLGVLSDSLLKYVFGGGLVIVVCILVRRGWLFTRHGSTPALAGGERLNIWRRIPCHLIPFLAMGLLLWRNALSYPYSFDDLTYQIAVPMRWKLANSLEVFGDNPFSAFPGVNLIGNLLLLKAGGLLAPLLFTYALGLILALAIHYLLRRRLAPWPATILSLSMVLSLSFLMVTTAAYAEPMILLQFVAILFLIERAGAWDWLLIGIFCGVAASVKLTGGIIAFAMLSFFVGKAWRFTPRQRLLTGLAFVGPMVLVTLLFYSRSWLATGDPLYPYFAGVFTDQPNLLATSEYHHDAGRINFGQKLDGPWQTLRYFLATPVLLTVGPIQETNYDAYFGLQCVIFAILIGSLFWPWRGRKPSSERDPMVGVYLGFALLFYTFWFFTAQQSRFLLPAFLCVVLAGSYARPLLSGRTGAILLSLLLILTVASLPPRILKQVVFGWKHLVAGNYRAVDYLDSAINDKYLSACVQIRERTPLNAKVMLIYEQRGLYVPRACVIGTPYFQDRYFTPPDEIASDDELMETLRQAKITHVLVAFNPKDPDRMEKYMKLGRPFQERMARLSQQNRLRTLWPDVTKVDVVDFALYAVGP